MDDLDMYELQAKAAKGEKLSQVEELRLELFEKVNALGIGAQGLGGLTTVLDVKIKDFPTHAANLPVAMIPNCAATRHAHFVLDGSGPVMLDPPSLDDWPALTYDAGKGGAPEIKKSDVTAGSFCIQVTSNSTKNFYVDQDGGAKDGTCP